MADVEEVIAARLLAHAGLAALVGTRVHPIVRPAKTAAQTVSPDAVTYKRLNVEYAQTLAGRATLAFATLEVVAWGSTFTKARAVAEQISQALDSWSNAASTPVVQDVMPAEEEGESWEEDFDGDDAFWVAQRFQVAYVRS
jgi:hypothetical protein